MKPRRGFSLIEMLIVISVGTVLLMVAMTVLYTLKETQSKARQRLTEGRMTARLADQFSRRRPCCRQDGTSPG